MTLQSLPAKSIEIQMSIDSSSCNSNRCEVFFNCSGWGYRWQFTVIEGVIGIYSWIGLAQVHLSFDIIKESALSSTYHLEIVNDNALIYIRHRFRLFLVQIRIKRIWLVHRICSCCTAVYLNCRSIATTPSCDIIDWGLYRRLLSFSDLLYFILRCSSQLLDFKLKIGDFTVFLAQQFVRSLKIS